MARIIGCSPETSTKLHQGQTLEFTAYTDSETGFNMSASNRIETYFYDTSGNIVGGTGEKGSPVTYYGAEYAKFSLEITSDLMNSGHSLSEVVKVEVNVYLRTGDGEWIYYYPVYNVTSDPLITEQPILTLATSSGASVQTNWTAAKVSYGDGATIYYQYFVGPSSTYSDSYHVGTTTSLNHLMTEAEIISKCGNGFGASSNGSDCYLFVRAYWQKGSTTGGWITPTGKKFTYYPTVNAPTGISNTPTKGRTTKVSFTTKAAGNNSTPQAVLRVYRNNNWQNIATGITSPFSVAESVWESYGEGPYSLCVAHEYYGRYANSNTFTFEYSPDNTVQVDGKDCVIYAVVDGVWKQCDAYIVDGGRWELCSTT